MADVFKNGFCGPQTTFKSIGLEGLGWAELGAVGVYVGWVGSVRGSHKRSIEWTVAGGSRCGEGPHTAFSGICFEGQWSWVHDICVL